MSNPNTQNTRNIPNDQNNPNNQNNNGNAQPKKSGIHGYAVVRFGGSVGVSAVCRKPGVWNVELSELLHDVGIGKVDPDCEMLSPQVILSFDDVKSVDALCKVLSVIRQRMEGGEPVQQTEAEQWEDARDMLLRMEIRNLDLSARARNIFLKRGCTTVADICQMTKTQFLNIPNAGAGTFKEVSRFLEVNGLAWASYNG